MPSSSDGNAGCSGQKRQPTNSGTKDLSGAVGSYSDYQEIQ